jgi:plastocyanin
MAFAFLTVTVASTMLLTNGLISMSMAQAPGTTFPPPITGTIRSQPAFEVSIPFTSPNATTFSPHEISIPTGMTVIWFNDDDDQHGLATFSNGTYSPPQPFSSDILPANGGTFIHTFSQPGKYLYFDPQSNTTSLGVVNVGEKTIEGSNINMMIGGINSIPFDPAKSRSVVLSFLPSSESIPPSTAITYNVALLNSEKKMIYSKNFDDADGILDIDLVPTHKNTTEFTDWGPDFIGQEQFRSTGVYHIKGPVLVDNVPYYIQVSMVARDNQVYPNSLTDIFELAPAQATNGNGNNTATK